MVSVALTEDKPDGTLRQYAPQTVPIADVAAHVVSTQVPDVLMLAMVSELPLM